MRPITIFGIRIAAGLSLMAAFAAAANAQWTVVRLHPAAPYQSEAYGARDGQQVGWTTDGGSNGWASLWNGTAATWVNLNPAGVTWGEAWGVDGTHQVGRVVLGSWFHASLWSGTAASWVDLNPAGVPASWAFSVDGGWQVGHAHMTAVGPDHAILWSGTAASWVDLNPAGATASGARGVNGGQIAGYATVDGNGHAGKWTGTAASWVDLHPASATSSICYGVHSGQQVGRAIVGSQWHAGLWNGTAASWVDLNPVGSGQSEAFGVDGGQQAGYAGVNGVLRACLWSGTAASWVDLYAFRPAGFSDTFATSIWHAGAFTYVVGHGHNDTTGHEEALLWVFNGTVWPSGFTVVVGRRVSGTLQSLFYSDDDRLVATVDPSADSAIPIHIETRGTCPIANPSSVQLVVELMSDVDGRGIYLRMYDYTANRWIDVYSGLVNTADSTITVTISANPSRFVNPSTREMRAALVFHEGAADIVQPVTIGIDRAIWIVRP